jgi:hypothetical protein
MVEEVTFVEELAAPFEPFALQARRAHAVGRARRVEIFMRRRREQASFHHRK